MNEVSHSQMLQALPATFERCFGDKDQLQMVMAPGRVNLLGDHTDYNDGFVLPMTVDRGIYIAARPRTDSTVRVYSARYDDTAEYSLETFPAPKPGSWLSYVAGVVEELRLRGHVDRGFDAVVDGNLNLGAGLSSSAALEVATAMTLQQLFEYDMSAVEQVKLCQHVEHNYANVLCGIMDQFASRVGRRDHALFLDCRSLEYKDIPMDLGDKRIVIIASGVSRTLAGSGYNTRTAECREAVVHFNQIDSNVTSMRDVTATMLDEHGDILRPDVRNRCAHVIAENQRVLDAAECLAADRLEDFGALMVESHRSLRDDYEVSVPEIDVLVKIANDTDGVLGSRITGGGFGGCTVSLVDDGAVATLTERVQTDYANRFNLEPMVFVLSGNLEAGPVTRP